MISGNKKNSSNHASNQLQKFVVATLSLAGGAAIQEFKHRLALAKLLLTAKTLPKENHGDSSSKHGGGIVYGSSVVGRRPSCAAAHNIAMLVEMLATGLPFVGWRVKPDPGD